MSAIIPKKPEEDPKKNLENRRLDLEEERLKEEKRSNEANENMRREELDSNEWMRREEIEETKRAKVITGTVSPAISAVVAAVGSYAGAILRSKQEKESNVHTPAQTAPQDDSSSVTRPEDTTISPIRKSSINDRCFEAVLRLKKLTEKNNISWRVIAKGYPRRAVDACGTSYIQVNEYETKYKSQTLRLQSCSAGSKTEFHLFVINHEGVSIFKFPIPSDEVILVSLYNVVESKSSVFNADSMLDELLS